MAELKPCPFCGDFGNLCQAENQAYEDVPKFLWFVRCNNKLCAIKPITPLYGTKQQAIETWNKRS